MTTTEVSEGVSTPEYNNGLFGPTPVDSVIVADGRGFFVTMPATICQKVPQVLLGSTMRVTEVVNTIGIIPSSMAQTPQVHDALQTPELSGGRDIIIFHGPGATEAEHVMPIVSAVVDAHSENLQNTRRNALGIVFSNLDGLPLLESQQTYTGRAKPSLWLRRLWNYRDNKRNDPYNLAVEEELRMSSFEQLRSLGLEFGAMDRVIIMGTSAGCSAAILTSAVLGEYLRKQGYSEGYIKNNMVTVLEDPVGVVPDPRLPKNYLYGTPLGIFKSLHEQRKKDYIVEKLSLWDRMKQYWFSQKEFWSHYNREINAGILTVSGVVGLLKELVTGQDIAKNSSRLVDAQYLPNNTRNRRGVKQGKLAAGAYQRYAEQITNPVLVKLYDHGISDGMKTEIVRSLLMDSDIKLSSSFVQRIIQNLAHIRINGTEKQKNKATEAVNSAMSRIFPLSIHAQGVLMGGHHNRGMAHPRTFLRDPDAGQINFIGLS